MSSDSGLRTGLFAPHVDDGVQDLLLSLTRSGGQTRRSGGETSYGRNKAGFKSAELLSLSLVVRIPPAPAPPPPQPLAVGLAKEPRLCTQVKLVQLIFSLTKIFFVYCF